MEKKKHILFIWDYCFWINISIFGSQGVAPKGLKFFTDPESFWIPLTLPYQKVIFFSRHLWINGVHQYSILSNFTHFLTTRTINLNCIIFVSPTVIHGDIEQKNPIFPLDSVLRPSN